jgi:uncharacterized protein YbjQ (UPF0145 family)
MKKIMPLFVLSLLLISSAFARNTLETYSIKETLALPKAKSILGNDVRFYFGTQKHGKIEKRLYQVRTNKKTNAFGKSDKEACQWVFISALLALKNSALQAGGNAIINIKSNYKHNLISSNTTFQCGAGTFVAGTALVGTIVKIRH